MHRLLPVLFVLLFTGCQTTQSGKIWLPPLPDYTPGESARVLTATELRAEATKVGQAVGSPFVKLNLTDGKYVVLSYQFLQDLIRWQQDFEKAMAFQGRPIRYVPNVWDCENYVQGIILAANLAASRYGGLQGAIIAGTMKVRQDNAWARVPAGGYHEVGIFATDKGIRVYESQTHWEIELKKYPNKHAFISGRIGG